MILKEPKSPARFCCLNEADQNIEYTKIVMEWTENTVTSFFYRRIYYKGSVNIGRSQYPLSFIRSRMCMLYWLGDVLPVLSVTQSCHSSNVYRYFRFKNL